MTVREQAIMKVKSLTNASLGACDKIKTASYGIGIAIVKSFRKVNQK